MKKYKGLILASLIVLAFVGGGAGYYLFRRIVIDNNIYNPPIDIDHEGLSIADIISSPYNLKRGLFENVFLSAGSEITLHNSKEDAGSYNCADYLYNLTVQYNPDFSDMIIDFMNPSYSGEQNTSTTTVYDYGNYKSAIKLGSVVNGAVLSVRLTAITDSYFDIYSDRINILENITNPQTPFNTAYLMKNFKWDFNNIGRNNSDQTVWDVLHPLVSTDYVCLYFLVSTSSTKKSLSATLSPLSGIKTYMDMYMYDYDFNPQNSNKIGNTWQLEYNKTYYLVIYLYSKPMTSYWLQYDCPSLSLQLL